MMLEITNAVTCEDQGARIQRAEVDQAAPVLAEPTGTICDITKGLNVCFGPLKKE